MWVAMLLDLIGDHSFGGFQGLAPWERVFRMNKAITDGVLLMPPAFANGLDVWSSGDGTPGSDTYANASNAAFVPADQDFAGCIEIQKTTTTTKLRCMGETPLLPGCYLRVTAQIKALSGSLPNVRIAAYAGQAGGGAVSGVSTSGPTKTLTSYGDVIEVSAIIGAGQRTGVDMVWGGNALFGHFGLDLTGPNGGVVRIDDIKIEDVTSVFMRDLISLVDVRDYGALGDGVTDDSAAFDAANTAANGRTILVPTGTYHLNNDVTLDAKIQFEGKVTMPTNKLFLMRQQFNLPAYIDAFKDEELAFKKTFQALLNNVDHDSLDLGGRRVWLTEPIDMQAATPERTSYATRRVIRNGQIEASPSGDWATQVATSQASYSASNNKKLTSVSNIANIQVGSLVEGVGVGREVFVRSKNVASQEITLSAALYDAEGTQNSTFRRFRYLLDFSGYTSLSKFTVSEIEFQCNNVASGILLAPSGIVFDINECFISWPGNRGITSHGSGCQGMLIDRCQFLSAEDASNVADRTTIAINAHSNDVKIRNNRATRFRHFAVLGGGNTLFIGNHFFQGDSVASGIRTAGLVIAKSHASSIITSNYIDDCFIEWTNEYDPAPEFSSEFSFSALSITDNVFLSGDVAPWFNYIVVKPHGEGHFLSGVNITGKRFKSLGATIDRAERVDTSFADLDYFRMRDVNFTANSFHGVVNRVSNPLRMKHTEGSVATTWTVDTNEKLPFNGQTLAVDSVVVLGRIRNSSNSVVFLSPAADTRKGSNFDQVQLTWQQPVRGAVQVAIRMD